jgi:hypothetical protein
MSTESISRTRSRIVQSPERIKRTIVTMGTTAIEDKRTVALHEGKARDLQAKVTALFNIEKVRILFIKRVVADGITGHSIMRRATTDNRERGPLPRDIPKGTRRPQRPTRRQENRKKRIKNETRCTSPQLPIKTALTTIPLARPQTTPKRPRQTRTRTKTRRGQTTRVPADHRAAAEGVRGDGVGEKG